MQIYITFIAYTCAKNRDTLVWVVSWIFLMFPVIISKLFFAHDVHKNIREKVHIILRIILILHFL